MAKRALTFSDYAKPKMAAPPVPQEQTRRSISNTVGAARVLRDRIDDLLTWAALTDAQRQALTDAGNAADKTIQELCRAGVTVWAEGGE